MPDDDDQQEREWVAYAAKQRAQGRCEYSGLEIHSCHRSICDCFDAWDCKECLP